MSYSLAGPYEWDENAALGSGRSALRAVADQIAAGEPLKACSNRAPGLYLLLLDAGDTGSPKIAGYWLVIGSSWLSRGPAGPPDKVPPVARPLLDAAVEEVWWNTLPVGPMRGSVWRPLIVLEWPAGLAVRSVSPPPGPPVELSDGEDDGAAEEESWLQPAETATPAAVPSGERMDGAATEAARYAHLPDERGLVLVIRGSLRKSRTLHEGSFEVLPGGAFGSGTDALAWDQWLDDAFGGGAEADATESGHHALGRPLMLPTGAVAFPLSAWLTRGLELWPPTPGEVAPGMLTDREIQVRWIAQSRQAILSTVAVLAIVIPFMIVVQAIAQPRPREAVDLPPPAPQPAMSVCSADHKRFVDEFRCQIAHLASQGDDALTTLACGDKDSEDVVLPSDGDLQAAYCGLRDRGADGWTAALQGADAADFAHVAASQACFNVLGHPYPYQLARGTDRLMGDTLAFLEDDMLGIQPLMELVSELDRSCDAYGERLEARVEGAIFATHVGGRGSAENESVRLRKTATGIATVGMSADAQRCFYVGMDDGVGADHFSGMCSQGGPPDRLDQASQTSKIWVALGGTGGEESADLVQRYVGARFGGELSASSGTPTWQCHLRLDGAIPTPTKRVRGLWDINIPTPNAYRTRGAGARSQLVLDVAINSIREGTDAGVCWQVVSKRLANYTPVHPLLGDLDASGWPSVEQQLCGQICASAYGISTLPKGVDWVTPDRDLSMCISQREPGKKGRVGRGTLDVLSLPWNYTSRKDWIKPKAAHVCAFNLIAQDRIPADGNFIVTERPAAQWAGETNSGSRIAGGPKGLAVRAVAGMSRYGTGSAWSKGSCGHVALQCFTGLMFEVLANDDYQRYDWPGAWKRDVGALSRKRQVELSKKYPWCAPLQPYLMQDRTGAQFDAPCRAGVEEAREHVSVAIQILSGDISARGGK